MGHTDLYQSVCVRVCLVQVVSSDTEGPLGDIHGTRAGSRAYAVPSQKLLGR